MKTKEIENEEIVEETEEEIEVEEEVDDTEEVKKLSDILEKKLEKVFKTIRENPVQKSFNYKEEVAINKSVLETDPYVRKMRPFVKLSPKMEEFVKQIRAIARGEAVQKTALNEGDDSAGGFTVPKIHLGTINWVNCWKIWK